LPFHLRVEKRESRGYRLRVFQERAKKKPTSSRSKTSVVVANHQPHAPYAGDITAYVSTSKAWLRPFRAHSGATAPDSHGIPRCGSEEAKAFPLKFKVEMPKNPEIRVMLLKTRDIISKQTFHLPPLESGLC